jgi:RNA polymerase sigma-70 factor (ECF subfamily)
MTTVEGARALEGDVALVHRMARGDEVAAHGLIEAHGDALFRFVLRRTGGSAEDAEEIVQDTFVAAVRMGETFDGSCSLFTWLCSLARLKIGDRLKVQSRLKRTAQQPTLSLDDEELGLRWQVHDPSISLEDLVDRLDRVRLVQALLDSMTSEQREAVTLRYVEQFSVGEIAKIMSRTEKAVERLLERAKERPRQEMFKWFGEESFRMMCFDLLML